jgi:hypothetical protein
MIASCAVQRRYLPILLGQIMYQQVSSNIASNYDLFGIEKTFRNMVGLPEVDWVMKSEKPRELRTSCTIQ